LATDAAIRAQDGDIDGALDSCRAILNVGRSIGDEPFLISTLTRINIGKLAIDSAQRVLGQGEASDAVIEKLQALVLDEISQPLLLFGIRGERATLDELVRRIRDAEIPLSVLGEVAAPGKTVPPVSSWGKLSFDIQRAVGLEWMHEIVAIEALPVYERPARLTAWEAEMQRVQEHHFGPISTYPYTAVIPALQMPAMRKAFDGYANYQCQLRTFVIALAAERHRRKTGQWPASIAAIDPAILNKPPLDPYSDKPFLLERQDGQFLVHTIGPNLQDDHGAYIPTLWPDGGFDDVGSEAWDVSLRKQKAGE
jgi:hypothetical protein